MEPLEIILILNAYRKIKINIEKVENIGNGTKYPIPSQISRQAKRRSHRAQDEHTEWSQERVTIGNITCTASGESSDSRG